MALYAQLVCTPFENRLYVGPADTVKEINDHAMRGAGMRSYSWLAGLILSLSFIGKAHVLEIAGQRIYVNTKSAALFYARLGDACRGEYSIERMEELYLEQKRGFVNEARFACCLPNAPEVEETTLSTLGYNHWQRLRIQGIAVPLIVRDAKALNRSERHFQYLLELDGGFFTFSTCSFTLAQLKVMVQLPLVGGGKKRSTWSDVILRTGVVIAAEGQNNYLIKPDGNFTQVLMRSEREGILDVKVTSKTENPKNSTMTFRSDGSFTV